MENGAKRAKTATGTRPGGYSEGGSQNEGDQGEEYEDSAPMETEEAEKADPSPVPATRERRTLRPRVPPASKAGRTRSTRHREEKIATLHYQEGQPLRDLHKYLGDAHEERSLVEVRIPSEYITLSNRLVRARQLWGSDVYTDDSDVVAVLQHTGFYLPVQTQPPPVISELCVTLRPLPPQARYTSVSRHGLRSRIWGSRQKAGAAKSGADRESPCSYRVERCRVVTPAGAMVELDPCSTDHSSPALPTFVQSADARVVNTRSAANNQERKQRFIQEVSIQYNLCNEPWMKYTLTVVADHGLKPHQWTSARLRKEVLFLETHTARFELSCDSCSRSGAGADASGSSSTEETFRWVKCNTPHTLAELQTIGVPLQAEEIEVINSKISWEEIRWSNDGVSVCGKEYPIVRLQFMNRKKVIK